MLLKRIQFFLSHPLFSLMHIDEDVLNIVPDHCWFYTVFDLQTNFDFPWNSLVLLREIVNIDRFDYSVDRFVDFIIFELVDCQFNIHVYRVHSSRPYYWFESKIPPVGINYWVVFDGMLPTRWTCSLPTLFIYTVRAFKMSALNHYIFMFR